MSAFPKRPVGAPPVDRLRKRFSINRVCVVADRGMISAETIAELEARKLLYILGVRERSDKLVRKLVLDDPAPFVPFFLTKRKKEIDYVAKAVTLAGGATSSAATDQMRKDAAARAAILAALERELKKGDKALVGNKSYRRFLMKPDDSHFAIDRAKVPTRTPSSTASSCSGPGLSPLEAMLVYKQSRATSESRVGGLGSSSLIVHSSGRRWGTALGARPRSVQRRSRHAAPSGH